MASSADLPGGLLERLRLPLILLSLVALYGAVQFQETRVPLARSLSYGLPLAAILYGGAALRESRTWLRNLALFVAGAMFCLEALVAHTVLDPEPPLARVELRQESVAVLALDSGGRFVVETQLSFSEVPNQPAPYQLVFERDGQTRNLGGEVSVGAGKTKPKLIRQALELPGTGPGQLRWGERDKNLSSKATVRIYTARLGSADWVFGALIALFLVAVFVQGVAGARGLRARFAAGSGLGVGLVFMLSRSGEAAKPFESLLSALIGAFFATLVGLILGGLCTRLFKQLR